MTMEEKIYEEIRKQAEKMESGQILSEIAFISLVEQGHIDEITASEHTEIFPDWVEKKEYNLGNYVKYNDKLYKCVQSHTSQSDWTPEKTESLWKISASPSEDFPAWSQPIGAHDAYGLDDRVTHKGKKWVSVAKNNVWEPGIYGWKEYNEEK